MSDKQSKTEALREEFGPDRVEKKLQEVMEERPKARHLLDFSIVLKALAAAVVVAAIAWLIFSAQIAGVALIVVFLGTWLGMAQLSYDRRRETRDAREADAEPKPSGYAADRGEVEAEQEQEGDAGDDDEPTAGNDSSAKREKAASEK